jgi:hypothetical protein
MFLPTDLRKIAELICNFDRPGRRFSHQTILPASSDLRMLNPIRLLFLSRIRRSIHLPRTTANGSRVLHHDRRIAGINLAAHNRSTRGAVREYLGHGKCSASRGPMRV